MNILHTKSRNRLSVDVLNKLSFIYINTRALRKDLGILFDDNYIENAMLDLEDDLLMAEHFQGLFQSTIPESVLGKRRREEIDVIEAQEVLNDINNTVQSVVQLDDFMDHFNFTCPDWPIRAYYFGPIYIRW
jgi:hypothetical protein